MTSDKALPRTLNLRPACIGLVLLLLSSCATLYPFDYYVVRDGPVSIGPEWIDIYCPDVIDTSLPDKELWLLLPTPLDVPDYRDQVAVFRDGSRTVEIYAEVVDTDGRVYVLKKWLTRASIAGRPRAGTYMRLTSDDLPRRMKITTIRLRSSYAFDLWEVLWTASRNPR